MDFELDLYLQASKHPFVTGEPFTRPYKPPLETPRMVSGPIYELFKSFQATLRSNVIVLGFFLIDTSINVIGFGII